MSKKSDLPRFSWQTKSVVLQGKPAKTFAKKTRLKTIYNVDYNV